MFPICWFFLMSIMKQYTKIKLKIAARKEGSSKKNGKKNKNMHAISTVHYHYKSFMSKRSRKKPTLNIIIPPLNYISFFVIFSSPLIKKYAKKMEINRTV